MQTPSSLVMSTTTFLDKFQRCVSRCKSILDLVYSRNDPRNCIESLDQVANELSRFGDFANAAVSLEVHGGRRVKAQKLQKAFNDYLSELNADRRIYDALHECLGNAYKLSDDEQRVGNSLLKAYYNSGIHLNDSTRHCISQIKAETDKTIIRIGRGTKAIQMQNLGKLCNLRWRMANLLGYKSYSAFASNGLLFNAPEKIEEFLSSHTHLNPEKSFPWSRQDLAQHLFQINNNLLQRFFGIQFDVSLGQILGQSTLKLQFHRDGMSLGHAHLISRPLGINFPCFHVLQTWRKASLQCPISIFVVPIQDTNCLSEMEAVSLYHEFGHVVHALVGETRLHQLAGTRCDADLSEVASTFMELLGGYETNPKELERGKLLARLDQFLHNERAASWEDTIAFERDVTEWMTTHHLNWQDLSGSAQHIQHYGSLYYTYQLGQVVADRLSKLDDKSAPLHWLSYGGSRSLRELSKEFRINI